MTTHGEGTALGSRQVGRLRIRGAVRTFSDVVAGFPAPRTWKGWFILLLCWPLTEWFIKTVVAAHRQPLVSATLPWIPTLVVIIAIVGWWRRRNGWDFWGVHRRRRRR